MFHFPIFNVFLFFYLKDYVATRWYRAPELCGSFFSKVMSSMQSKLILLAHYVCMCILKFLMHEVVNCVVHHISFLLNIFSLFYFLFLCKDHESIDSVKCNTVILRQVHRFLSLKNLKKFILGSARLGPSSEA